MQGAPKPGKALGSLIAAAAVFVETSKLVLFVRKQTIRSAKIGVFQESGSKKYHQLILGKPSGDVYVDDKGIKDGDFFANEICS